MALTTKVNLKEQLPSVLLEMGRRYIATEFPDYAMNNDNMYLEMRTMVEKMATQLVLCEDLPLEPLKTFEAKTTFYYPKTWWQKLKEDHFPNWYLERWPVEKEATERKVTVKMSAAYPKLPDMPKYKDTPYKFHYAQTF